MNLHKWLDRVDKYPLVCCRVGHEPHQQ
ncbi:hypothetical protein CY0110_17657 [Crocosphaera chwakensis CCY0110]|uniref:Uncharacterized protein n=1 Tax=Crocosphaera chwakensis CCY0110 TaxID=391612 RepID=A3IIL3_9CHRO|nr:hypothetical protein CY0110_17657 [Crocosphaera chwakensis CCY0110]